MALVEVHGNQWSSIAKHIPGRTSQQCRARWIVFSLSTPVSIIGTLSEAEKTCETLLSGAFTTEWVHKDPAL